MGVDDEYKDVVNEDLDGITEGMEKMQIKVMGDCDAPEIEDSDDGDNLSLDLDPEDFKPSEKHSKYTTIGERE